MSPAIVSTKKQMKRSTSKKFSLPVGLLLLALFLGNPSSQAASPENLALKAGADQWLKKGKLEKAIPLYEELIRRDKQFANVYYNLGTAYYLTGNLEKAVKNLEAFLQIKTSDAEAWYNLGCLKLRLGRFEEAQAHFQSALACRACPSVFLPKIKEALLLASSLTSLARS